MSNDDLGLPAFHDPQRVAINRVYTRKGDAGTTSLVGGQTVPKGDLRIECYGVVDELNAFTGQAILSLGEEIERAVDRSDGPIDANDERRRLIDHLVRVQHQLFNLGSVLATLPEDIHPRQPRIVAGDVVWLEQEMDRCNGGLTPLRSFVLPGGGRSNTDLHICRTVCRRAERLLCRLAATETVDAEALGYLNRLSDAYFVWSRWVVRIADGAEVLWEPNRASGAAPAPADEGAP
jgi:cob(I)alamin adenosyltransferase